MDWVHAGRLVSLRKPGDINDQDDATRAAERNIRPIGLVSIFMRLIGSVAAKQFAGLFAANFDPEDWEGDWTPINVGVAAPGGMQQIQHTVVELMTSNPDWGVLQIDACAAFQECSRRVFLQRIARVWPGDPLGPVDHNFALDELLKDLGSRVDSALLYYLDDGTICGPVAQLARLIRLLTEEGGEFEFTARTGMRLNIPKCSVWVLDDMLRSVHGHARVRVEPADWRIYSSVKRPDIVVIDARGPGRHLIIDVKTVDPTGRTRLATDHTDEMALGGLVEVERALPDEYTDHGRAPNAIGQPLAKPPAGLRLLALRRRSAPPPRAPASARHAAALRGAAAPSAGLTADILAALPAPLVTVYTMGLW
ncbi:hypothetical protein AB1Y20_009855 [Prymnesium parvum]|uniref:CDAN1-interacting nuclease 1 n=1 Tax=Prymnesium parvum TaxID=97485 RepID=A0AB34K5R1_PRYPA